MSSTPPPNASSFVTNAKAQGAAVLPIAKGFLESAAAVAGGYVEAQVPTLDADVFEFTVNLVPKGPTQDFLRSLVASTGVQAAVDSLVIKYIGQALISLDARIAAAPVTPTTP